MDAGREMDALVAEKVMGLPREAWRSRCYVEGHNFDDYGYDSSDHEMPESGWCYTCVRSVRDARADGDVLPPPFSTDIAAAWLVVEKLAEGGKGWWRFQQFGWGWDVYWMSGSAHDPVTLADARAGTAPLAICRAALAAVGGA